MPPAEPPEDACGTPQVLIVGIDGSDLSWRAAAYAIGLARRELGRCRLLFVCVAPPVGQYGLVPQLMSAALATRRELANDIQATLGLELEKDHIDWEFQVRAGNPYTELRKLAADVHADAIILGASNSLRHRLCGSLPVRLVKHRHWPIIVVP